MSESLSDAQIIDAAKSRMNYQEDRHCSTCRFSRQKAVDFHECHINQMFPFIVVATASCQYHEKECRTMSESIHDEDDLLGLAVSK